MVALRKQDGASVCVCVSRAALAVTVPTLLTQFFWAWLGLDIILKAVWVSVTAWGLWAPGVGDALSQGTQPITLGDCSSVGGAEVMSAGCQHRGSWKSAPAQMGVDQACPVSLGAW